MPAKLNVPGSETAVRAMLELSTDPLYTPLKKLRLR